MPKVGRNPPVSISSTGLVLPFKTLDSFYLIRKKNLSADMHSGKVEIRMFFFVECVTFDITYDITEKSG